MDAHHHRRLLRHEGRLDALRWAVESVVRPGSRVLDAGCGSGVLSVFAARAGASAVLAVDLDATDLARLLVRDNGASDVVEVRTADLLDLKPNDVGRFDVIVAMIYLNDPRRDKRQSALAFHLRDELLAPGGRLVPDGVRYSARLVDWPSQDDAARRREVDRELLDVESRHDLDLRALREHAHTTVDSLAFPSRAIGGRFEQPDLRALGPPAAAINVDYVSEPRVTYPATVELPVSTNGRATAVIFTQTLVFDGRPLFENETVAWLRTPTDVVAGSTITVSLDERWLALNLLDLQQDDQ